MDSLGGGRELSADPLEGLLANLSAKRSAGPRVALSPERPRPAAQPPITVAETANTLVNGNSRSQQHVRWAPQPPQQAAELPDHDADAQSVPSASSSSAVAHRDIRADIRQEQTIVSDMPAAARSRESFGSEAATSDRSSRGAGRQRRHRDSRREHSPASGEDAEALYITSSASESPESSSSTRHADVTSSRPGFSLPPASLPIRSASTTAVAPTGATMAAARPAANGIAIQPSKDVDAAPKDLVSALLAGGQDAELEWEETERTSHARVLAALHALRPSELSFLLSGWQADWLLGDEDLCPAPVANTVMRIQARRRLRRQRGLGERIGPDSSDGGAFDVRGGPAPLRRSNAASSRRRPRDPAAVMAPRPGEAVTKTHSRLADFHRAFRASG